MERTAPLPFSHANAALEVDEVRFYQGQGTNDREETSFAFHYLVALDSTFWMACGQLCARHRRYWMFLQS